MTSTGRINYIDELKGFILCLVCLGHIAYSELSYVMNWMSLMRMFTFFFLSGLYSHEDDFQHLRIMQ